MPEYTVQRFRGGYAAVWPQLDANGQILRDAKGKPKRTREKLFAADRPSADAEARQRWQSSGDEPWTVGRIVETYMNAREADGIASTARQRDAWKAMRGFWAPVDPSLIDDAMAREYVRQRKRSASTTRYELSMLSVALRWAMKVEKILVAKEVWRPAAPERKVRHLTRAKFKAWFKEVKAPHARLYVRLGIYTIARPTAILDLTWDQVDWDHSTVDLNPPGRKQTNKRRPVVPMNEEAMAALREAFEARQCEYVIERGGKRVHSIKKAFQAASERSGIKVTPYTLRHTGAVWSVEQGASMDELAQFMGHDDSVTTSKHYARFSPDHLRKVSANLHLEEV